MVENVGYISPVTPRYTLNNDAAPARHADIVNPVELAAHMEEAGRDAQLSLGMAPHWHVSADGHAYLVQSKHPVGADPELLLLEGCVPATPAHPAGRTRQAGGRWTGARGAAEYDELLFWLHEEEMRHRIHAGVAAAVAAAGRAMYCVPLGVPVSIPLFPVTRRTWRDSVRLASMAGVRLFN